jgi:hypothetical protein
MLIFRQLFDAASSTYTCVLGDAQAAVSYFVGYMIRSGGRSRR